MTSISLVNQETKLPMENKKFGCRDLGIEQNCKQLVWPLEEIEIKVIQCSASDVGDFTEVGDHLFVQVYNHMVLHISPVHIIVKEWRNQSTLLWGVLQHIWMTACYIQSIIKPCQFYLLNNSKICLCHHHLSPSYNHIFLELLYQPPNQFTVPFLSPSISFSTQQPV